MARLLLDQLGHSYSPRAANRSYALQPMAFAFEDGGAYALLGPSGCGKTTLLNILSGLLRPSEGRVRFDERDVTTAAPGARNIAQVFQFPVVYDTMTVAENLAFPLRNRRLEPRVIEAKVAEVAEMLELGPLLGRRAAGLGADQKQKISLGRGLVRDDVAAILFDEPLTVIDPHLKWLLRRKLKQVHERYRRTLVYVTHDQNEALTFADRVIVMLDGRMLQEGTPQDLFERPAHRFVGFFIGSPGMNFVPVVPSSQGGFELAGTAERLGVALPARMARPPFEIGVRPEFLTLHASPGERRVPVRVTGVEDLGNFKLVQVRIGEAPLIVKLAEGLPVPAGSAHLEFPLHHTRLYADGELVG